MDHLNKSKINTTTVRNTKLYHETKEVRIKMLFQITFYMLPFIYKQTWKYDKK